MGMGIYTGNNQLFSVTTSLPDDSDPLDASEFNVAFEQLSDKTAYLALRTKGLPSQNWITGAQTWKSALVAADQALNLYALAGATYSIGSAGYWSDSGGGNLYALWLTIPNGVLLTAVAISIQGTVTGSASLKLFRQNNTTGIADVTQIGSTITVGGVNTNWTPILITLAHVVDTTQYSYFLQITSSTSGENWNTPKIIYYPLVPQTGVQISQGTPQVSGAPVWDSAYSQWLVAATDSTGTYFVLRSSDGYSWDALGGVRSADYSFGATSATADSVPGFAVMVRPSDGLVAIQSAAVRATFNQATQTWANVVLSNSAAAAANYGVYMVNKALFVTMQGTGVSLMSPFWSPDGITWTAATTWAPTNPYYPNRYAMVNGDTATPPFVATFNGTPGYQKFSFTQDGKVWQETSLPALLAGEQVVGAIFDHAAQALYPGTTFGGLYVLVSSSTQARLFAQASVLVATIPHQCLGLATNNNEMVTMAAFRKTKVTGTVTTRWTAIQSVDLGVTWQVTPFDTSDNLTSFTGTFGPNWQTNIFGLTGSNGQFLYINAGTTYARTVTSGQLQQVF